MFKPRNILLPAVAGILVVSILLIFPSIFKDKNELQSYLHFVTRLVLLLFIYISLFLYFTQQLQFKAEFQKLFYRGVILSLVYTAFANIGMFVNHFMRPTVNIQGVSLFKLWYLQSSNFLKYGLIYTVFTILFLHFHPANQLRKKKQA